jgi:hypothetical protein
MNYEALLAQSEPWLQYAIRIQLCRHPKEDLTALRAKALEDPKIATFLKDVADFHSTLVTSHKNAGLPIHKLLFLLDLGLDTDVPEIRTAIEEILRHRDVNGIYQSLTCIPVHFGGTGKDTFCWCLCDAPLLLTALVIASEDMEIAILPGVAYLTALVHDNGFPCAVSPELGTFRGPGRKGDCCPYATLIMAGLLSRIPQYRDSAAAHTAVAALLNLWENSLTEHPYIFYMGTDFRKLKAPPLWYDIVSVLDVLSRYPYARTDPRFIEMLTLLQSKQDATGMWTPESVYTKFKDWDFGQKKAPSPYLTFLCERILQRIQEA